jgi:YD repeat-containing protein
MNFNPPLKVKTRIFSSLFIRENWRGVITAMIALSGMAAFHSWGEDATGNDFKLNISQSGNNHDLTWNVPDVVLQTSQTLSGDWVDLPEATSPHTVAGNLDKSFFRLRKVSTISGVEPAFLPTSGGTLYVRGVNFDANSTVTLNGMPAASVTFVDSSLLMVNVAALSAGHYDVAVVNGASGPAGSTLSKGLTVESTPLASLEVPPGMAEGRTATGEINLTHVDLQIDCPVGPDFVIARTHRSRHDAVGSPFGTAWDFSSNISVAMDGADVVVNDGMGRSDKFFRQPNGTFQRAEFFREGSMTGQVFTLTLADKTTWTFRALDAAVAPGKIDAITDRNGNAMTYSYGVNGRLDQVTDALGRTFQFSYNGSGQLTSVTDFAGRSITYAYYGTSEPGGSEGDLKSMTSPAVTGTPNGNDFPLGKTITYTYTKGFADERLNHNLTGVIDNTGVQVQTIAYTTELNPTHFDFDRAVSIALGANPPTVFSCEPLTPSPSNRYAKTKVTMNDPVGNVSETLYDSKNRPVSIKELTGRATPGIPVTAVGNQPTNKLRASDPAFFETTLAYNLDSQVTQITYPRGNRVTMTYASDLSIAAPVRERGNLRQVTQTPAPGVPSDQAQITEKFEYLPEFGMREGGALEYDLFESYDFLTAREYGLSRGLNAYASVQGGTVFDDFESWYLVCHYGMGGAHASPTKHTDPRGNVWNYGYDANGNLTSSQAPGLATGDSFDYNAAGQLTAHVHPADANGRRKRDTFNYYSSGTQKGYLQSAVEDAGAGGLALTTTYAYDAVGNVTSVTDPRGNDTQFVFNQLDQLMQVKSAPGGGGGRSQVDYTYNGRVTGHTGCIPSLVINNQNQLIAGKSAPGGGGLRTQVDFLYLIKRPIKINVIQTTDRPFRTALLVYSIDNEPAIGRKDVSHFDENGSPIGDGKITTIYGRDSIGQLTSVTNEVSAVASTVTQFEYDANGQVTKVLSPLAVSGAAPFNTVQTQYDERGLPFQEISAPGSPDQSTTQYDYDTNGNVSRVSEGLEGTPQITTMVADGFVFHKTRKGSEQINVLQLQSAVLSGGTGAITPMESDGFSDSRVADLVIRKTSKNFNEQYFYSNQEESFAIRRGRKSDPMEYLVARIPERNLLLRDARASLADPAYKAACLSKREYCKRDEYLVGSDYSDAVQAPVAYNVGFAMKGGDQLLKYAIPLRCQATADAYTARTITDPLGDTTINHFDACGNLVRSTVTSPSDPVSGASGVKLAETTYTYNALGRLTNATEAILDPIGTPTGSSSTSAVFADNGQIISSTDPNGNATSYRYDTTGRLSTVTDPKGNSTAYAYDANGNITTVTDTLKSDLGNPDLVFTKNFTYDKLNRCTSATDNVGNSETFAYDSRGNVVRSTDARGNVSQFAYDGLGRLTRSGRDMNNNGSTQDPVDIVTTQSWDANSRLTSQIDPNGNVTSYGYDSLDRLTQTIAADGTAHSATYDVHGNVVSSTDANGTVTTYNYDLNNRLLQKNIVPAVGVATTTTLETFAYDGLGRVTQANNNASTTSFTYDSLGRTLTETQNGQTVTSTYDAAGNRLTVAYPSGRTLGYAYDAANLPTTVSLLASSDGEALGVLSTNHYIGGQLERVVNRNNTRTSYSYNGVAGTANPLGDSGWGQISRVQTVNFTSGAVINDTTYRYDAAQNQTGKTTSFPGKVTAKAYQYDAADRLVNTVVTTNGAQTANITYTLDKAGNRLNVTGDNHPGAYTLSNTLPVPADFQVNQYTTTPVGNFSYDKNGNRTTETSGATTLRTFSYDYANRLVAINNGSTGAPIAVYGYDALGRRIMKGTLSGATSNTTRFVYDGDKVIEERDGSGTVTALLVKQADTLKSKLLRAIDASMVVIRRNGTNYWPISDESGSAMALTLDNGSVAERYEYADFGEPAFFDGAGNAIPGSAVGNVYLWGGMRYDRESGLYQSGGMSADPRLGTTLCASHSSYDWYPANHNIVIRSEQYTTKPVAIRGGGTPKVCVPKTTPMPQYLL